MGTAIINVKITIHNEPDQAVKIPAFSAFLEGKDVKKLQSILLNPSYIILPIKIAKRNKPMKQAKSQYI